MDFLQKYFYGVFELALPRNARKRTKKKGKKKMSDGGWVGLGFSKCTGGSVDFFGGPSLPLRQALRPVSRSRWAWTPPRVVPIQQTFRFSRNLSRFPK
jgi:hypothetical protein